MSYVGAIHNQCNQLKNRLNDVTLQNQLLSEERNELEQKRDDLKQAKAKLEEARAFLMKEHETLKVASIQYEKASKAQVNKLIAERDELVLERDFHAKKQKELEDHMERVTAPRLAGLQEELAGLQEELAKQVKLRDDAVADATGVQRQRNDDRELGRTFGQIHLA